MPEAEWFIGLEPFNLFRFIDLKSFNVLRQPGCYIMLCSVGCFDKPFNLRMDVSLLRARFKQISTCSHLQQ